MTKANGTKKAQAELSLEHVTHEYLYPNVISGKIQELKIPTIQELEFLSCDDIANIKSYFRKEEKKLRGMLRQVYSELTSIISDTMLFNKIYGCNEGRCNWHGLDYANVPDVVRAEIHENGSMDMLMKLGRNRSGKVFTCRFGRFIAEWCSRTPQPCAKFGCYEHSAVLLPFVRDVNTGEDTSAPKRPKKKCERFDQCHGCTPMQDEECVFVAADQSVLDNCAEYLRQTHEEINARLEFVLAYIHNLTEAAEQAFEYKPTIDLVDYCYLGHYGTQIFELSRGQDGFMRCRAGVYEIRRLDSAKPGIHVLKFTKYEDIDDSSITGLSAEIVELCSPEQPADKVYLQIDDLLYLDEHADYREVWLRLAEGSTTAKYRVQMLRDFFEQIKPEE